MEGNERDGPLLRNSDIEAKLCQAYQVGEKDTARQQRTRRFRVRNCLKREEGVKDNG